MVTNGKGLLSSQNNGREESPEIPSKIGIRNDKEPFVQVEHTLIRRWGRILNKAQKGTAWGYVVMQSFRNYDTKLAWPSYSTLANIMGCSVNTCICIVTTLEKFGLIIKMRMPDKQNNFYSIPALPDPPDTPPETVVEEQVPRRVFGERTVSEAVLAGERRLKEGAQRRLASLVAAKPDPMKWNCNDFLNYFSACYRATFSMPDKRATVTNRDRANWKHLIETYDRRKVKGAVDFVIKNWDNLEYLTGMPTPTAFFRHRDEIIRDMAGRSSDLGYSDADVGVGMRRKKY